MLLFTGKHCYKINLECTFADKWLLLGRGSPALRGSGNVIWRRGFRKALCRAPESSEQHEERGAVPTEGWQGPRRWEHGERPVLLGYSEEPRTLDCKPGARFWPGSRVPRAAPWALSNPSSVFSNSFPTQVITMLSNPNTKRTCKM